MEDNEEVQSLWKSLEPSGEVKIVLTVLYSLILALGIVGNSVTLHVSRRLQRSGYLQKSVTDHMQSLACSDLLVLLIGMPVELYSAIWFPFSSSSADVSCRIYSFLFEACSYATVLNIASLSFERYLAICHPFRYKALSGRRSTALLLGAWVCSALVALPLLVATGTEGLAPEGQQGPAQNLTFCTNLRQHWVMYRTSIFTAFLLYLLVLGSVAFMCRAMIAVLRAPMGPSGSGANGAPKHESARMKAARKQTILFLVLIVCALLVCWMPNQIRRLMTAAVPKSDWTASYLRSYVQLHPVADSFFYLSSVLNPLLYNLSSSQFRSAFLQTLLCRLSLPHANRRALDSSLASKSSRNTSRPLLRRSLDRLRAAAGHRASQSSPAERPNPPDPADPPLTSDPQEDETSPPAGGHFRPPENTSDHRRTLTFDPQEDETSPPAGGHFRPPENTSDHRRTLTFDPQEDETSPPAGGHFRPPENTDL